MLRKFAAFDVLEATMAPMGASALRTYAHRHAFKYEPRPGYLYIRSRAISSRTNDNFDTFPAEEIEKGYKSFIGKPVFVNHNNDNHRRARGVIIDAALHRDTNPDGSPDTWSEVLMEVDAVRFPKLAKAILAGHIDRTSMGTDVAYSLCSFCGNKASTPLDYCKHIPKMKGQRIYRTTASGKKEGVLVSEICHGLKFFENSLLVEEPADPTAFFTGVEDHSGMSVRASRVTAKPAKAPGESAPTKGVKTDSCAQCGKPIYHVKDSAAGGWQHDIDGAAGLPHQAFPASGKTASLVYLSGLDWFEAKDKKVSEMNETELAQHRVNQAAGKKWNVDNQPHVDNVLEHWNAATDHERHTGMNWYKDAHELTKHIASDTKTPMHVAAGLMSNYSPQTHWATNMMNAAKAMRGKKGIGGGGSGIFASHGQREAADRMMGTQGHAQEHYEDVLGGPKTKAFAHLIHHGGNADPKDPKVVVDRHALSVACGSRATDMAYSYSGLGGKKRYKQVADTYHKAAQHITKTTGVKVEAHQVQAATWLARQRLNAADDTHGIDKQASNETEKWNEYAGEHHPLAMGKEPGTGYSSSPPPEDAPEDVKHSHELLSEGHHGDLHKPVATTDRRRKPRLPGSDHTLTASLVYLGFGETKAPMDVDTLRDEECPVCGEADSYDGNECQVCAYTAPPKMFQDPDLDMAKQMDLRKDIQDESMSDPNGDGMPDVIPGSDGTPGDAIPPNPERVPDPEDVAQQQMNQIGEDGQPLQPEQLDENGQPVAGAEQQPGMPQDPNAMPMDPEQDVADPDMPPGLPADTEGVPEAGTPGDAVPDLVCPVCGYQEPAEPPQSVDMDSASLPVSGAEGALCPNCQQGQMVSTKQVEQQVGQPIVARRRASVYL